MYRACWCFALLACVQAGWWEDLGEELKEELGVSLREIESPGNSTEGAQALRIDLLGIGLSFSKASDGDALSIGFYFDKDKQEGRARRKNAASMILPMIFGYKAATLLMGALVVVSGILLKSALAAKTALLITGSVALQKLFEPHSEETHQIHLVPQYEDVHSYSSDFHAPVSYHAPYPHDGNYEESGVSVQYASAPLVAATGGNATTTPASHTELKRRNFIRKKPVVQPVFTIHRMSTD